MTILLGSEGNYVRSWQRVVGVHASKVDGKFGPGTDASVRLWQRSRGVEPDGVIGPATRAALLPGDLIKSYEGCVLQAYDDERKSALSVRLLHRVGSRWVRADGRTCVGVPTIGWGDTAAPRRGVEHCTQAEADAWFAEDLEKTRMPAVRRWVNGDAGQVAAACSFSYNCGTGALARLMAGGVDRNEWLSWSKVGESHDAGLKMRRAEEWAMWVGV